MKRAGKRGSKKMPAEITVYDEMDTSAMIDRSEPMKFEDIGLRLPKRTSTEVVSIRLPHQMLNELRVLGSERDIPYQALMKLFLEDGIAAFKKKGLKAV